MVFHEYLSLGLQALDCTQNKDEVIYIMKTNEAIMYQTSVKEIGQDALDFSEIKMAIFFGDSAPDALRSSCYLIGVYPINGLIEPGMSLVIDDEDYQITAVGHEVQHNLVNLGHMAVSFTGKQQAELAGTLYVTDTGVPEMKTGSTIMIKA